MILFKRCYEETSSMYEKKSYLVLINDDIVSKETKEYLKKISKIRQQARDVDECGGSENCLDISIKSIVVGEDSQGTG